MTEDSEILLMLVVAALVGAACGAGARPRGRFKVELVVVAPVAALVANMVWLYAAHWRDAVAGAADGVQFVGGAFLTGIGVGIWGAVPAASVAIVAHALRRLSGRGRRTA